MSREGSTGGPGSGGFAAVVRARFDEAGANGQVRASTLLRLAQDVAWQHGASLGLDRAWYEEHRLVWLVRAADLEILQPIPMGAALRLSTAVIGHRKIWARRRVEIRLAGPGTPADAATGQRPSEAGGEPSPAAVAVTDWVLVDLAGRIQRIPESFSAIFSVPLADFEITRVPLGPVPAGAVRTTLVVRPQELDPNGHVNNAVHLDWLEEAVGAAGSPMDGALGAQLSGIPRRYQVEYLAPLEPGAHLTMAAWPADEGWRAVLARPDGGAEAARMRLIVG